ncbi:MAG: iron-containing alcohol dehydrogenase [Actinomycetota bacterium]
MVELPEVFVFDAGDEDDAAQSLGNWLNSLGVESPLVLSSVHGQTLAARLPGPRHASPDRTADQRAASGLGSEAQRAGADAIVAIGGGRCLDVGKLAAARAGLVVLAVPTQLSHDGICSPVAVVPGDSGVSESLGAIAPRAVFISIPTLLHAPVASVRAGLGDLLANPLALRDWALAAEHGVEEIDRGAWDLSAESFELIEPHLDSDPAGLADDPAFVRRLSDALVLSGMAMIRAGTSRPASGAEHEISHAIDGAFGGRGMHGAQVAFGCIFSVALYGEDTTPVQQRLARLGLPHSPSDLGLDEDDVVKLLLEAPDTRPGRFTILEDADLDEGAARRLVQRIWND